MSTVPSRGLDSHVVLVEASPIFEQLSRFLLRAAAAFRFIECRGEGAVNFSFGSAFVLCILVRSGVAHFCTRLRRYAMQPMTILKSILFLHWFLLAIALIGISGCGKSPEEIAQDRFRDFLLDPIPESVQELRIVHADDYTPQLGLMLRFKIHPDDFQKIATAKNLQRRQPGELHREDDLFNESDFLRMGGGDELYESFRVDRGSYSFKVNADHTEVIFQSNYRYPSPEPYDADRPQFDSMKEFFNQSPPKTWKIATADSVPESQREAVVEMLDVLLAVYQDTAQPDQPVIFIEAGWNPLSYKYLDYEWRRPSIEDQVLRHLPKFPELRRLDLTATHPDNPDREANAITDDGLVHLRGLSQLESLSLAASRIGDDGMRHIGELPQLRSLNLDRTNVTDVGLKSLQSLRRLEVLSLVETMVTSSGMQSLESLKTLRGLNVSFTNVSDAGLQHIGRLTKLEYLDLSPGGELRHAIDDEALLHLDELRELRVLKLSGTRVKGKGFAAVQNMSKLKCLNLSWTPVTDDGLKYVSGLSELEVLIIHKGEHVTDAGLKYLSGLNRLDVLALAGTAVTGSGIVHLKELPHLAVLNLSETPLTSGPLVHLIPVKSLKLLDLHGTTITDDAIEHLQHMDQLELLIISDTRITQEGFYLLREALPNSDVWY